MHLFQYASNNPSNRTDPLGLQVESKGESNVAIDFGRAPGRGFVYDLSSRSWGDPVYHSYFEYRRSMTIQEKQVAQHAKTKKELRRPHSERTTIWEDIPYYIPAGMYPRFRSPKFQVPKGSEVVTTIGPLIATGAIKKLSPIHKAKEVFLIVKGFKLYLKWALAIAEHMKWIGYWDRGIRTDEGVWWQEVFRHLPGFKRNPLGIWWNAQAYYEQKHFPNVSLESNARDRIYPPTDLPYDPYIKQLPRTPIQGVKMMKWRSAEKARRYWERLQNRRKRCWPRDKGS